ncbi:hypothetical protein BDL97_10G057800 [Sphagnum fallax]|nr:hypothetical protein BDL97_10G057800 [Sphagnum fallax]
MSKAAAIKSELDDVDALWNTALNDFETEQHDGQESSIGDESDPEDHGATAQKQLSADVKPGINTVGQRNLLQLQQSMQALQTSLGVCQVGQQGGLQMLNGQQLEQHGQGAKGSMPRALPMRGTRASVQPQVTQQMHRSDAAMGGEEVITLRLSKKEHASAQRKARRTIVNNARKLAITRKANGQKPFFVTCDSSGKPKPPHRNIWVNMLRGYCSCLDPSIDNINAQPRALMNQVRNRLEENWEYVGNDLSYREFKAQVNVFLKNRRHGLKLLIEAGGARPNDCAEEHWENMKRLITSEAKRGEAARNRAMRARVNTLRRSGRCGEVGSNHAMKTRDNASSHSGHGGEENESGQPPTPAELNANLSKEKGAAKPSVSTHSKCVASPSMKMAGSISKPQGVTPCTPSGSDATNWHHRLSTLEGLMAQVVAAVMKNNAAAATMEGTINQEEVVNVPSGSDATNWHHRLSTLEGLMAQVVATMMKNKAPTASVEGTKNQEEVANVPHAPRMMKPYDLDKTFEGSALPTVNRHESMISHRYPDEGNTTGLSNTISEVGNAQQEPLVDGSHKQSTMVGTQEESTKVVVGLEKSNLNNQEVADSMKQQRKRKSLSKKTATEVTSRSEDVFHVSPTHKLRSSEGQSILKQRIKVELLDPAS